MKKSKKQAYIPLLIVLLLAVAVAFVALISNKNDGVTNFNSCVEKGYPVLESFPRQCNVNGRIYIEKITEDLIGGQRDENGCLTPAGYSYNETIGACVREFELQGVLREPLKIAVDSLGKQYGLTIEKVYSLSRCQSCFVVDVDILGQKKSLDIQNEKVVDDFK